MRAISQSKWFYKIVERIVPFMAILLITMPVWLSFFHPAVAAYFIIAYLIYFIYKSIKTIYFAGISFRLMEKARQIDWKQRLGSVSGGEKIQHAILIVNCRESYEKVAKSLDCIVKQTLDSRGVVVVLAMEEAEGKDAKDRAKKLLHSHKKYFKDILVTYHTLQPGEVIGKASNAAYAGKVMDAYFQKSGVDRENVLVTVCDADSLLPSQYLAYLTYEYLIDPERLYRFYWAPVLLYNNFWKLWLPVRVQTILGSVARLAFLSMKDDLIQISTYSTNLKLLESVGFWDTDIIPEDWHIQIQAFFKYGDKIRTTPIYIPIVRDGLRAEGTINTIKSRYAQERRWAWGLTDIPYAIKRSFETPDIPIIAKLKKIFFLTEIHLLWPTSFFFLTLSASMPSLVNPVFGRTVLGFLLPKFSSFMLTIASILLFGMMYFDYHVRKQIKIKTEWKNVPMLIIQWYLLPIISFFFSSLPALDAHMRILLGKGIDYKATKKL